MRDPRREVSIFGGPQFETTTVALAAHLMGSFTHASEEAARAELRAQLQDVLNSMEALDREVLALRHFEQLSPIETAQVLGIKEKTAAMRYIRALRRLKGLLSSLGDHWQDA